VHQPAVGLAEDIPGRGRNDMFNCLLQSQSRFLSLGTQPGGRTTVHDHGLTGHEG
jgi:hypothetical protein